MIAMKAIRARPKTTSCCDGTNRVERNIRGDISLPKLLIAKTADAIQVYRFMRKALMRDDHWQAFVTREAVLDYVKDCDDESSDGVELFKLLLMHCRSSMRIFPNSRLGANVRDVGKHVPAEYKDFECKSE